MHAKRLRRWRRSVLSVALCLAFPFAVSAQDQAGDMRLFRIGTGGVGGTYYPVGGLIARVISQPPSSIPCEAGEHCGVAGLVAVAQSANGSVANVRSIAAGSLESGFSQSDVAYWAYSGTSMFEAEGAYRGLRAISGLYAESVHIVAAASSAIHTVEDLRGKRVSLDEPGSGTLVDARLVLEAYGLSEEDFQPEYIKPALASERVSAGELDAFFIVSGYPVSSIRELAATTDITIVPIAGRERRALLEEFDFFSSGSIEAGVYEGVGETPTISVNALWLTRSDVPEELIYRITSVLWSDSARTILDGGHPRAGEVRLENALEGIAIPLHPGAERAYHELGLLP